MLEHRKKGGTAECDTLPGSRTGVDISDFASAVVLLNGYGYYVSQVAKKCSKETDKEYINCTCAVQFDSRLACNAK
jgi:hypothetical protein